MNSDMPLFPDAQVPPTLFSLQPARVSEDELSEVNSSTSALAPLTALQPINLSPQFPSLLISSFAL